MDITNLHKRQDGFTLIEVIVASAVLLIVVMALSALLLQGYRVMGSAGKRSESLHLAQEEMEEAIIDPDFEPASEYVEIERDNREITVFEKTVYGTLVTVKRALPGKSGGEVMYQYFEVEGVKDP